MSPHFWAIYCINKDYTLMKIKRQSSTAVKYQCQIMVLDHVRRVKLLNC